MKLYEIVDIASSECSILLNGSCCFSHGRGILLINSWECARFFEEQDLVTYVPFFPERQHEMWQLYISHQNEQ